MQPQMQKQAVHGENLYYLCITDEHERRTAEEWLEKHHSGTRAKLVQELRLDRLTERHVVRALVRKPERSKKLTQAVPLHTDEHGVKETAPRETEAAMKPLLDEMVECEPIAVKDYWIEDGSDDGDGDLNTSKFLEALGKTCVPGCIKHYERSRTVRLGWV